MGEQVRVVEIDRFVESPRGKVVVDHFEVLVDRARLERLLPGLLSAQLDHRVIDHRRVERDRGCGIERVDPQPTDSGRGHPASGFAI